MSDLVLILLTLVAYVPWTCFWAFRETAGSYSVLVVVYWVMLYAWDHLTPRIVLPELPKRASAALTAVVSLVCVLTMVYVSGAYVGFRLNFNLLDVYELRADFVEIDMPRLLSYLYSASRAITPLLMVHFLARGQHKIAALCGFVQFLNFSADGSKAALFAATIGVAGYLVFRRGRLSWLTWFLSATCIAAVVENKVLQTHYLLSVIVRRALFVPALLNYHYYDFFSNNPPDYFAQGFMRVFGAVSKYRVPIPFLIGDVYFGNPSMRANNGLFSDAYSNLGIAGVFLMPLFVVLACRMLETCSTGLSHRVVFAACATSTLSLVSSTFTTALLTHGLILLWLVLRFLPREGQSTSTTPSETQRA